MRWIEILQEARTDRYKEMFKALYPGGELPGPLLNYINAVKLDFKRQDRIVWMLRWRRLATLTNNTTQGERVLDDDLRQRLLARYSNGLPESTVNLITERMSPYQTWQHYAAMMSQIPKMAAVVWGDQRPKQLQDELSSIEQEWTEKQDQHIPHSGEETVFLRLDDEWAWYDLEVPSCDREAKAMGHCGNGAGEPDETVLSLRRHVGDQLYRPSLTFIHKSDGSLGEMKGRNNNKPDQKYHAAIAALLADPRITGISGGGYKPENNFKMDDLPANIRADLQKKNPMLRDVHELYDYWHELDKPEDGLGAVLKKRITSGLESSMKGLGFDYRGVDLDRDVILVESYRDADDYMGSYHSYTALVKAMFTDKLPDALERQYPRLSKQQADTISAAAERDLFPTAFETLLPYDVDFQMSDDMHPELKEDGSIVVELPIPDYIEKMLGDEKWSHPPSELAEVRDGYAELDHLIDESDPVLGLVYGYAQACEQAVTHKVGDDVKWPEPSTELVQAIYDHYQEVKDDTFTMNDRNQMKFDF